MVSAPNLNGEPEGELEEELNLADETEVFDANMEPFNPSEINIAVEPKSLDTLIKRLKHDEIDMNTEFQRYADLWDDGKMSRFFESILILIPLPPFFFDASNEDKWLVVDGLQRLSSIRKFVIEKKLKLSGLEFLTHLNGLTYDKLDRQYQRRIEEHNVQLYLIKPGTPESVKYSVFKRINTGGFTLNAQEIRHALAQPRERALLTELAKSELAQKMLGNLSKRMRVQELVLRFWAFYTFDYLADDNKKELAAFLDKAIENLKKMSDEEQGFCKELYCKALNRCYEMLGHSGFEKKPHPVSRKKIINASLFELWMVTMAKISTEEYSALFSKRELFREKVIELLKDQTFLDAVTYSTQTPRHVEIRYQKVNSLLKEVLND